MRSSFAQVPASRATMGANRSAMASSFREMYTEKNSVVVAAISPLLLEHRDFVYREYLELPIVF